MKPRNHVVLAMIKASKKSGAHIKSEKANRRKEKIETKKIINAELKISKNKP